MVCNDKKDIMMRYFHDKCDASDFQKSTIYLYPTLELDLCNRNQESGQILYRVSVFLQRNELSNNNWQISADTCSSVFTRETVVTPIYFTSSSHQVYTAFRKATSGEWKLIQNQ